MLEGMGRSRTALFLASCVLGGAVALACGTSNGDAGTPGVDDPPTTDTTDEPQKPSRPAFEAGFADDGGTTGDGGTTNEGGTTTCQDPGDPGGNAGGARSLPATDDCDNDFKTVNGVLSTPVDIDVYKVSATDKGPIPPCLLDTSFSMKTAGVELCVFVHCTNDAAQKTNVTGCNAGTKATDPVSTWEGCCAVGPADPTPSWDCAGIPDDDSADFLMQVKATATTKECQGYSFSYRY